jgi:hypothetical protein
MNPGTSEGKQFLSDKTQGVNPGTSEEENIPVSKNTGDDPRY